MDSIKKMIKFTKNHFLSGLKKEKNIPDSSSLKKSCNLFKIITIWAPIFAIFILIATMYYIFIYPIDLIKKIFIKQTD